MKKLNDNSREKTLVIGTYLPTLDGWRALAIFLVIFGHGYDSIVKLLGASFLGQFSGLQEIGLVGVQIFFGLSGFLITTKLLEEEERAGKISLKSFYLRRSFRIFPASFLFLGVVGLLGVFGVLSFSPDRWLHTLFFGSNYTTAESSWYLGHFWSLAVEEHFYFVWPLVFLLLKKNSTRTKFVLVSALVVAFWRILDFRLQITQAPPALFWGRTDIQVDGILWGVMAALLYNNKLWKEKMQRSLSLPWVFPLLLLAYIGLQTLNSLDWKLSLPLLTVKAILVPFLIIGTMVNSTKLPGLILETKAFRWVGRISYSLYLWQQLFMVWKPFQIPGFELVQSIPFNILGAFTLGILCHYFVERPMIKLGHGIAKKMKNRNPNQESVGNSIKLAPREDVH